MLSGVPHSQAAAIPVDRQQRNPLMTEAGFQLLNRIRQHADAPRWNFEVGDRLLPEDLPSVEAFRQRVFAPRQYESHRPSSELLAWVQRMRDRIPLFRAHLPEGFNLARDWVYIPTTCREDIATRLDQWVPLDADLSRLIVYDTSGTTGHALVLPHHPVTVAEHHSLVEYGLDQYGLQAQFDFDRVACINVCAQAHTYVFATVFSIWNQAGFAKVNLKASEWPQGMDSARRFFQDLSPQFLTGDPVAFAEMMRWQIPIRPLALISTAVALSPGLQQLLQEHFDCPVIDWYSSTETGPIAYANPNGEGMSLLPPDIYLEAVDEHGFPVAPGELGELTVTGGAESLFAAAAISHGGLGTVELRARWQWRGQTLLAGCARASAGVFSSYGWLGCESGGYR